MATLGEAYIQIRADLSPFSRDLEKQLKVATGSFERELKASLDRSLVQTSARVGAQAGDNLSHGIRRSFDDNLGKKGSFQRIASALAASLDDGISALPSEIKAGLVAGIAAASPLVLAGIGAAVASGVALGVTGLGVALSFQYEDVQREATQTFNNLRQVLVESAEPFGAAVVRNLDLIDARINRMQGQIGRIFKTSASFLDPLVEGALRGLQHFLNGLEDGLGDTGGFIRVISRGLELVGVAAGEIFDTLASTGESGRKALQDLIGLTLLLAVGMAKLVAVATQVYGVLRDLAILVPIVGGYIQEVFGTIDQLNSTTSVYVTTNVELEAALGNTIVMTDAQKKALQELNEVYEEGKERLYGMIGAEIDWEESLDNVRESIKKTGGVLTFESKEGRRAIEDLATALKAAEERAQTRFENHELTAEQASELYAQEIKKLKELAAQSGITGTEFDALFGQITNAASVRFDQQKKTLEESTEAGRKFGRRLADAYHNAILLQGALNAIRGPGGGGAQAGRVRAANGDIFSSPTNVLLAEAGPEVVIPLTRPRRATQLLRESGLMTLIGDGGGSVVNVYIGNEQLDARMYRVAETAGRQQARQMEQAPRRL